MFDTEKNLENWPNLGISYYFYSVRVLQRLQPNIYPLFPLSLEATVF